MPPDSSAIDTALLQKLSSDATLLDLMKNGVYFDLAPPNSTRFVIVSLEEASDRQQFGMRSFEEALYLVKAVVLTTIADSNTLIRDATARIDTLLDRTVLTATGYTTMACHREGRMRTTEPDELDPVVMWYHRGGHYRVVMST